MHRYLDDLRKDTDAYVAPWHLHSSIIDIERGTRPKLNEYQPEYAVGHAHGFCDTEGLLESHETGKRRKLTATRHDEIFNGGRA